MPKRSEPLLERLRLTEEERDRIAERLSDPANVPSQVDWADPGPDPFGMDWIWVQPEPAEVGTKVSPEAL